MGAERENKKETNKPLQNKKSRSKNQNGQHCYHVHFWALHHKKDMHWPGLIQRKPTKIEKLIKHDTCLKIENMFSLVARTFNNKKSSRT